MNFSAIIGVGLTNFSFVSHVLSNDAEALVLLAVLSKDAEGSIIYRCDEISISFFGLHVYKHYDITATPLGQKLIDWLIKNWYI